MLKGGLITQQNLGANSPNIAYRQENIASAPNLFRSIEHYNNLSPMFRGPATSDTLIRLSKMGLNNVYKARVTYKPKVYKVVKNKFVNKKMAKTARSVIRHRPLASYFHLKQAKRMPHLAGILLN